MTAKRITLPLSAEDRHSLSRGDAVLISGVVYTARDQAHKRIAAALERGDPPPFDLDGAAIYYCGPTPAPSGEVIGSCGPTTSGRMDAYTPLLIEHGLAVTIGKGERSEQVKRAIAEHGAVYFIAVGGAAAVYQSCVTSCEVVAYPELGCEAVLRLTVRDLPAFVGEL